MKRGATVLLALLLAGCGSSRSRDEEPRAVTSPSTEARLTELQTSMTELLERLDVLNARIARLESGTPAASPAGPPAADMAEAYRKGLMLFGQNKHAEARTAFQRVFNSEPGGELADNALFWIGETYFAAGDYSSALRHYERVAKEYADQNKAPDALFKMGMAYEKTGDLGMARRAFDECIRKYPYSTPAASARVELKRIKY